MKRETPEQTLVHRPIMQLAELHLERFPDLQGLIHVPNEGKRTKAGHGILIGLGMRPGASDLLLLRARRGYFGLAMELKPPGELKRTSRAQEAFLRQQAAAGWACCVCDDALWGWRVIRWYVSVSEGEQGCAMPQMWPHLRWFSR